jgi:hypothetical protein
MPYLHRWPLSRRPIAWRPGAAGADHLTGGPSFYGELMHGWWRDIDPDTLTVVLLCIISALMTVIVGVVFWQTAG